METSTAPECGKGPDNGGHGGGNVRCDHHIVFSLRCETPNPIQTLYSEELRRPLWEQS